MPPLILDLHDDGNPPPKLGPFFEVPFQPRRRRRPRLPVVPPDRLRFFSALLLPTSGSLWIPRRLRLASVSALGVRVSVLTPSASFKYLLVFAAAIVLLRRHRPAL